MPGENAADSETLLAQLRAARLHPVAAGPMARYQAALEDLGTGADRCRAGVDSGVPGAATRRCCW